MSPGDAARSAPRRPGLRLALLGAGLVLSFVAVTLASGLSTRRVEGWFTGNGALGPLIFLLAAALLSAVSFPGPVLAGASGLLFGTALGFPVSLTSAVLSATLCFFVARGAGRPAAEALLGDRGRELRGLIERRGFLAVLYARLLPGLPYTALNYAAGLTRIAYPPFLLATTLGSAPRTYAYVALGGSLSHLDSPAALLAFGALIAMGLVGLLIATRDPELRHHARMALGWAERRRARRRSGGRSGVG